MKSAKPVQRLEYDPKLSNGWPPKAVSLDGKLAAGLYLEAEAAGIRSTGIGCYFDDTFHELLGQATTDFQDLYHFTVGGPVEDLRLITLPPYAHLTARN